MRVKTSADRARVEGWRRDLRQLAALVTEKHWWYKSVPLPSQFQTLRRKIDAAIPTLSDEQIVVEFQALLATLHDGHTLIFPFGMERGGLKRLPLTFYDFDDGLAVIAGDGPYASLVGRRVLEIDGSPVNDVMRRIEPLMSVENDSQRRWAAPLYLTFPAFLKRGGVGTGRGPVRLTLDGEGGRQSIDVTPQDPPLDPGKLILGLRPKPGSAPLFLSRLDDAYWFTSLENGSTVYLQMNRVLNDPKNGLEQFSAKLQETLLEREPPTLIIDLRNNNGGNAAVLPPLIRSIVAFRALRPKAAIYVLIGRQTFSAAQTLVNRIEEYVDPIFVGEPTGSKPNRFGNGSGFQLDYSRLRGEISTGYNRGATSRDSRNSTPPKISVGLTLNDWLIGRDAVLEKVRQMIR